MLFGLSREEFLDLTPAGYRQMAEQAKLKRKLDSGLFEAMTAQLTAMVANTGFRGFEEARQPKEFMSSEWAKQEEAPKRLTRKRKVAIAEDWRIRLRSICKLEPDARKFV